MDKMVNITTAKFEKAARALGEVLRLRHFEYGSPEDETLSDAQAILNDTLEELKHNQ